MASQLVQSMLDNAVHIGSRAKYWSPKMRDSLYGVQNGVHVFDLSVTAKHLESVKAALQDLSSKGKSILIVGTKMQAREIVREIGESTGAFYVNSKWVPGLLTNFPTLKKRIATYNEYEKAILSGGFEGLTKKENAMRMKELEKLHKAYSGIKEMKRTPDAILVVDGHFESLALSEARKLGIPTFALLGSTGDIDMTTDYVPMNVNSLKPLRFVLEFLSPALKRVARETTAAPSDRMGQVTQRRGDRSNDRRPTGRLPRRETTEATAVAAEVAPTEAPAAE